MLITRRIGKAHRWTIVGTSIGLVIRPASIGLYSLYYIGPIPVLGWPAMAIGLLGLALSLFHGAPGFELARHFNWLESKSVVEGLQDQAIIETINGVIWGATYGCLGALADWMLRRRKQQECLPAQKPTEEC